MTHLGDRSLAVAFVLAVTLLFPVRLAGALAADSKTGSALADERQDASKRLQAFCKLKDWTNAEAVCARISSDYPDDACNSWLILAEACHKAGQTTEAVSILERAVPQLNSNEAKKRTSLDLAHFCAQIGLIEKRAKAFETVIDLFPEEKAKWRDFMARDVIDGAYRLQNEGEHTKAIQAFQDLIDRFPDCQGWVESAHVCVAESLNSLGKTTEALDYAKKLYDEQPQMRAGALFAIGVVSYTSGKWEDSVTFFQRTVFEHPANGHAVLAKDCLVFALQKTGRTDEAVEMLRAKLKDESNPDRKTALLLQIAETYREAKRHQEAIRTFREVRTLKTATSEARASATYRTGLCYEAMGNRRSARMCMEQAAKLCPDSEWARKARGSLYVWANNSEQVGAQ